MSLLDYFKSANSSDVASAASAIKSMESGQNLPTSISNKELLKVKESLQVVERKSGKRTTYKEIEKREIAKSAMMFGTTAAVRNYLKQFPSLTECTV